MGAFEDQSGKISAKIFKEDLLNYCGASRQEVFQGPSFGVDTSVIDLGNGKVLAISSDPLSLIPFLGMKVSAWLSIHLIVNDMCTTGFPPEYVQFVLNLPTSVSRDVFKNYWNEMHQLCEKHNIAITGGHTGQIPGLESTISGGGTMFLTAPKDRVLTSNNCKEDDVIIATKSAAISSSALLCRAFPNTVSEKLGAETQQKGADNFWSLSVLKESQIAVNTLIPNKTLHAMHDVTEGGVLGAVYEMAEASGLGITINADTILVQDEIRQVAELFKIDPLYSIGAGCMLMSVSPYAADTLLQALNKEGIQATAIGTFRKDTTKQITRDGTTSSFNFDGTDPYWTAFFNAIKEGWT